MTAQPDNTIDSEVEEILHTLLNFRDPWSQLDKAETKLANLIAQEANKAVVAELARLTNHDNYISDAHLGQVVSVKTIENRIKALTADKEQA